MKPFCNFISQNSFWIVVFVGTTECARIRYLEFFCSRQPHMYIRRIVYFQNNFLRCRGYSNIHLNLCICQPYFAIGNVYAFMRLITCEACIYKYKFLSLQKFFFQNGSMFPAIALALLSHTLISRYG